MIFPSAQSKSCAGNAAAAHAVAAGCSDATEPEPITRTASPRRALQEAMTTDASVVRNSLGLHRLSATLSQARVRAVAGRRDFEDAALTLTARAVAAAALARNESRGCHHRAEYPDAAPDQGRSIVVRLSDDRDAVCAQALAEVC